MKIILLGEGRHGKDETASILRGMKYRATSSSDFACRLFIYYALRDKYGYSSTEECHADRVNHRDEWYDLICEFNKDDKTRLAKLIFQDNDIYIGLRDREEFLTAREEGIFDFAIWIDASKRVGKTEGEGSMNVTSDLADIIIDNNGTLEELRTNVENAIVELEKRKGDALRSEIPLLQFDEDAARKDIISLLIPAKQRKISTAKNKILRAKFKAYDEAVMRKAEKVVQLLGHEWPAMEAKLEAMEQLVMYMDNKYICSVDPEKSTKKEIVENTEFFSLKNLVPQEMNEEARTGFNHAELNAAD